MFPGDLEEFQFLIDFSDRYLGTMPPTTATPCTKRATTVLRCSLRPPTTVETVATSRRTNIHSRTHNRAPGITTRVTTTTSSHITTSTSTNTLVHFPPHLSSPIKPSSGCTRLSSSSCACATRRSTTIKSSASVSNTCTKRRARSRAT